MLNPDDIKAGYTLGYADALMLRELVEKTRWIPIGERLPEGSERISDHVSVLVSEGHNRFVAFYNMFYGVFLDDPFGESMSGTITHWMPLPEPPA